MLVNARIKRFVSFGKYRDDTFSDLFKAAGIATDVLPRPEDNITFLD